MALSTSQTLKMHLMAPLKNTRLSLGEVSRAGPLHIAFEIDGWPFACPIDTDTDTNMNPVHPFRIGFAIPEIGNTRPVDFYF
jgi:hypothetical protein